MSENEAKKRTWSWLGFFFAPYYYAGYGKLGKGILLGIVGVVIPILGFFIVGIIGALNAKKELPIGKEKFSWKNVGLTLLILVPLNMATQYFIFNFQNKTPDCSSLETKNLVIDIAKEELTKNGLSEMIDSTTFKVENIRTINYNKNVDSYECAASFKIINEKSEDYPITYTVQKIDDKQAFYVEVEGL